MNTIKPRKKESLGVYMLTNTLVVMLLTVAFVATVAAPRRRRR